MLKRIISMRLECTALEGERDVRIMPVGQKKREKKSMRVTNLIMVGAHRTTQHYSFFLGRGEVYFQLEGIWTAEMQKKPAVQINAPR